VFEDHTEYIYCRLTFDAPQRGRPINRRHQLSVSRSERTMKHFSMSTRRRKCSYSCIFSHNQLNRKVSPSLLRAQSIELCNLKCLSIIKAGPRQRPAMPKTEAPRDRFWSLHFEWSEWWVCGVGPAARQWALIFDYSLTNNRLYGLQRKRVYTKFSKKYLRI